MSLKPQKAPSSRGLRASKGANRLGALDLAALQAGGADVRLAHMALGILDGHLLDVGAEHAVGNAVRVADAAAGHRMLAANFTYLRHVDQLHFLSVLPVEDKKR